MYYKFFMLLIHFLIQQVQSVANDLLQLDLGRFYGTRKVAKSSGATSIGYLSFILRIQRNNRFQQILRIHSPLGTPYRIH